MTTTSSVFTVVYSAVLVGYVRKLVYMFRDFTATSSVCTIVYSAALVVRELLYLFGDK